MAIGSAGIVRVGAVEVPGHRGSGLGGSDHPMRLMTRRAAGLDGPPWDAGARRAVAAFFDELAPEWHTRTSAERTAVVVDALARGDVGTGRVAIEPGSGTGAYSALIGERFRLVASVEIAEEMLRLAPPGASCRVLADGAELPMATGCADAVVLVNAFLFPTEVDRVLAPSGCVVWVSSSGDQTPIHLTAEEVARALPGLWHGVEGRAGAGTWCVLRREAG